MANAPRRLSTEERRAQLLELGLKLFGDRSYEDVEISEIAGLAGVSKGLLYHYFGSKNDFYAAVVELAAGRLTDAIQTDAGAPGLERARAGIEAYLSYVDERDQAFLALMHGGVGADPKVLAVTERTREAIADQVLAGIGIVEPSPIYRLAARSWLGAVEAASLDWLRHRDLEREQLVELALVSLATHMAVARRSDPLAGIKPDPELASMLMALFLPG